MPGSGSAVIACLRTALRVAVFTTPGQDQVRQLLGARLRIRNEEDETVRVTIGGWRIDHADSETWHEELTGSMAEPPGSQIPNGQFPVEAHAIASVAVRTGPTLREWIDRGGDQSELVTITASTSPEAPRQVWRLTIDGPLLNPEFGNASGYRVVAHTPAVVHCAQMYREYPPEPSPAE